MVQGRLLSAGSCSNTCNHCQPVRQRLQQASKRGLALQCLLSERQAFGSAGACGAVHGNASFAAILAYDVVVSSTELHVAAHEPV